MNNNKNDNELAEKERFYDELMAYIIIKGGCKMSIDLLKALPLGDIVNLIWPNDLRIKVYQTSPKEVSVGKKPSPKEISEAFAKLFVY